MRILYVEDNPANISLLQRVARMGGHLVINYTEGEKAIANLPTDKPDLILIDLQLAGALDGLSVVRQLRADGLKTPIIAVTAYAMVGDRERCIEAGCDGYLAKPLPITELVELVQKYELEVQSAAFAVPPPIESAEVRAVSTTPDAATMNTVETPAMSDETISTPSAPKVDADDLAGQFLIAAHDVYDHPTHPERIELPADRLPPARPASTSAAQGTSTANGIVPN